MKTPYANSAFCNLAAGEKKSSQAKIVPIQKPARNAENLAGGEKQSSQLIFPEKNLTAARVATPNLKFRHFIQKIPILTLDL